MATRWRDTRPARPAGKYVAFGVVFDGGEAVLDTVSDRKRAAFSAVGIVEVGELAEAPEAPEPEAPEPDEAEPAKAAPRSKRKG
ncbi:hypothetical protein [Leucobacter luti]|uniref:hypothetical protein n=1 Tax=Leucobacter luti TaxID=340320 RepID=UPI003D060270